MARKEEAEGHLRSGLSPSAIADRMGISTSSVIQYLRTRVGEGSLRFSDIYFSFNESQREILQHVMEKHEQSGTIDFQLLKSNGFAEEELRLFSSLRSTRVFAGDMYEYVSELEIALHDFVRERLEAEFGPGEHGWWRAGVSSDIRARCASRREEDDDPSEEAYAYTDLVSLSKIMKKNWTLFSDELPTKYSSSKSALDSDFARLNRIRNAVMHPVKKRRWTEADFQFVRELKDRLFG